MAVPRWAWPQSQRYSTNNLSLLWFTKQCHNEKETQGVEVLVFGDASFQSCSFMSLFMDHLLCSAHSGFPSRIKKQLDSDSSPRGEIRLRVFEVNWKHIWHEKTKSCTVQPHNPSVSLAITLSSTFPLNGRGLAGFGEDRAGFKFMLPNWLTMWFLWALVSPSGDKNIYLERF